MVYVVRFLLALIFPALIVYGIVTVSRIVDLGRRARTLRHFLYASGSGALRAVPCRFDGPWWWLAWGIKGAWRDVDLWPTPGGVLMGVGRARDSLFVHLALRDAPTPPGPPPRRVIERAEMAGREVRLVFAKGSAPSGAAFVILPRDRAEHEALCRAFAGFVSGGPP